jgi:hypothetical protein
MFLLSGFSKFYPNTVDFTKQLVDLGIVNWCKAPLLARLAISLEFFLAFAMMQRNYLRRIVLPATMALLVFFCVHLAIQMSIHGAFAGNCGCFGNLLPMSPMAAFVKNVLAIAALFFLWKRKDYLGEDKNNYHVLLWLLAGSTAIVFMLSPYAPCKSTPVQVIEQTASSELTTINEVAINNPSSTSGKSTIDSSKLKSAPQEKAPPAKVSRFAPYNTFGGKVVSVDQNKKIICQFVPGCDHCQHVGKQLVALSKKEKLPPMYIIFMDEEAEKIPSFFKIIGASFPYQLMDPATFFGTLKVPNTPGVTFLWNGNERYNSSGNEKDSFQVQAFLKAVKAKE